MGSAKNQSKKKKKGKKAIVGNELGIRNYTSWMAKKIKKKEEKKGCRIFEAHWQIGIVDFLR